MAAHPHVAQVKRNTKTAYVGAAVLTGFMIFLLLGPYNISRGMQQSFVTLFALVVLGTMWNLLAGYGGMVSIGQQAYIGIGAYAMVAFSDLLGINPFIAAPLAVLFAAAVSYPISYLAFRLSGGYFAIGTWVIAEVMRILVMQVQSLGGGSGISLSAFSGFDPAHRIAYVYWLSLVGVFIAVMVSFLVMRSRMGLAFTAIRDDAVAARSLGVKVTRSRRLVFVIAAGGSALAGAMTAASTLRVQPESAFSVQYAAFMIFMVIIGGIGTIEGPLIGAALFWALQTYLSDLGAWYLVILGLLAITVTLTMPKGIWGLISRGGRIQLFPVGYRLANLPSTREV